MSGPVRQAKMLGASLESLGALSTSLGRIASGVPASTAHSVTAEAPQIAKYAIESFDMARETMTTAQLHATDSGTLLAPVMGPLGASFVAAFVQAEGSYLEGATRLAASQVGMGIATADAAQAYEATDDGRAHAFRAIRSTEV